MSRQRKRVLFVIGWPLGYGGHIKSTCSVARYLHQAENYEVSVVAPDGPFKSEFGKFGIKVYKCGLLNKKFPANMFSVFLLLAIYIKWPFSVIHAQDPQALRPSYLVSAFLPVLFVYTEAGGEGAKIYFPEGCPIVSYSRELVKFFSKFPYLAKNINMIPQRIDTKIFFPRETAKQDINNTSSLNKEKEAFKIFFAMRFDQGKEEWIKNIFSSINKILSISDGINFTIAGDGPSLDYYKKIGREINKNFGREAVSFADGIYSNDEICDYYSMADLVIGHGRGAMEAMACGRPVIVLGKYGKATLVDESTVDQISEFNFSGRHMQTYPDLGRDLADLISTLYSDKPMRERLGMFNRRFIVENYAAEDGAHALALLYLKSKMMPFSLKVIKLAKWSWREFVVRKFEMLGRKTSQA